MTTSGGFAPVEMFATYTPEFTMYGDGTVVFRPLTDMADPTREGLARFVRGRLGEEGIQALLRYALGAGRLLDAREHYEQNGCADCPSTHFTLNAAGLDKQIQIDALGMVDAVGQDALDRRAFAMLAETLNGFEQRARNGELGEATLYDPSHYQVFLFEGFGEPQQVGDWPWSDVTPADFVVDGDDWRLRAILDRAQVAALTDVPSPGQAQFYFVDEAGKLWELAVRPLLPDELAAEGLD